MADVLNIDGDRLWQSLMDLASIGATPLGGVNRQALTELDKQARALLSRWCEEAGCTLRTDRVGNLFARRAGQDDSLPAVMMGSHIDTQPTGGKFDGAYGVMAGLEVLRSLTDAKVATKRPVEVVAWTNEEGTRFAPSMMGSYVYAGLMKLEDALAVRDEDGMSVATALQAISAQGEADRHDRPFAYFEAHIEQGPILEATGKTIGVVTAAQGQCWYQITLKGRAAHAGSTPMHLRRDALVGAASIVTAVHRIGRSRPPGVATVGRIIATPNSPNVIPDSVYLTAEIRHPDNAVRTELEEALADAIAQACDDNGLESEVKKVLDQPAAPFDASCIEAVRRAAQRHGFPHADIVSGAAHDAVALSRIVPAGMIFVPCAEGISHNELESATPQDLAAGCQVLLDAVSDFANR